MSRHTLYDRALNGPDKSFAASLLVTAEIEHTTSDGTGLLCRLVEGDGPVGADLMVVGQLMHWSAAVLACAQPGDMVAVQGRADPIDPGIGQTRPLLMVNNPAYVEVWRRAAAGPNAQHEPGGATA